MRHRKSRLRLAGPSDHARAVLRNLAISLLTHGRIETTVKRAKVLRPFIEKIVTQSRRCASAVDYATRDHEYRMVRSQLHDNHATAIATRVWGPYFLHRPGGYTRIMRNGFRVGDNAEMAIIEFVLSTAGESHAQLVAALSAYAPGGARFLNAWRLLAKPRIDFEVRTADQSAGQVHFALNASLQGKLPDVRWPTMNKKPIPMELTLSISAPRVGTETRLSNSSLKDPVDHSKRITFQLVPNRDGRASTIEGYVSLAKVEQHKRYCSIAVDGPTGEVFHATLIGEGSEDV
ncbi:50S ribosomal protein L17 [Sphaerotilus microaerophilus]|uniref:50S ribosomal protein L17 n=1 Tax=Sphaerotilus microaerophilus TaxID=2914710 RepID=A0ABM7YL94_9BURK|nr:50S ribosomal protein L17 [Sphaerotilus sp. FB-5]BDI05173.1 hypothetical protein CATMQ487_21430 [Sphaerotilus sp. FB-5]